MIKGRIHSIETMGLFDGPGVRCVVFLQGCKLRCAYCHNPDTWGMTGGEEMDADTLMAMILRYRPYFEASGGGVTFSGGDPLLQPEFLVEMLKRCKSEGIHTAIDTSGFGHGDYDEVLSYADLVLLDVKHIEPQAHYQLTGGDYREFWYFVEQLNDSKVPVWVRHVVVPELNDDVAHMIKMKRFLKEIHHLEKVELLPYHRMGTEKYEKLGLKYRLGHVAEMDQERLRSLQNIVNL